MVGAIRQLRLTPHPHDPAKIKSLVTVQIWTLVVALSAPSSRSTLPRLCWIGLALPMSGCSAGGRILCRIATCSDRLVTNRLAAICLAATVSTGYEAKHYPGFPRFDPSSRRSISLADVSTCGLSLGSAFHSSCSVCGAARHREHGRGVDSVTAGAHWDALRDRLPLGRAG
jgi:hypothetical protein